MTSSKKHLRFLFQYFPSSNSSKGDESSLQTSISRLLAVLHTGLSSPLSSISITRWAITQHLLKPKQRQFSSTALTGMKTLWLELPMHDLEAKSWNISPQRAFCSSPSDTRVSLQRHAVLWAPCISTSYILSLITQVLLSTKQQPEDLPKESYNFCTSRLPADTSSLAGTKKTLRMHKKEWAREVTFCSFLSYWGFVTKLPCTEAHLESNKGQAPIKKPVWTSAGVQQHLTSQWVFVSIPISYVDGLAAIRSQTPFAPTTETYMTGINVVGTGRDLEFTSKSNV